ncbi:MAG: hypothetical protein OXU45_08925 [Candidatus Melainabacteria bacterium]|nr:hypothetical protein [Candidatus Melainabacteria bacterium]
MTLLATSPISTTEAHSSSCPEKTELLVAMDQFALSIEGKLPAECDFHIPEISIDPLEHGLKRSATSTTELELAGARYTVNSEIVAKDGHLRKAKVLLRPLKAARPIHLVTSRPESPIYRFAAALVDKAIGRAHDIDSLFIRGLD